MPLQNLDIYKIPCTEKMLNLFNLESRFETKKTPNQVECFFISSTS